MSAHIEEWQLAAPLRIANNEWRSIRSVIVQLFDGTHQGRGEAQGVMYMNESAERMLEQIQSIANRVQRGISRQELLEILPAGGARNAIDCALWDWEAKQSGRSIWDLVAISPSPVTTVFTIGLEESPDKMAEMARTAKRFPVLKIKLNADRPLERLQAIRKSRPEAKIVVDANQSWNFDLLKAILPECVKLGIDMIEQPLPRGKDEELENFQSPITLAADESCLDTSELDIACKRYGMINIKLDKTGGLTEALRLARTAKEKGCKLMVGNMAGTSLSMAPSFVVAQLCDFADIDGPLLLKYDHPNGIHYSDSQVQVFQSGFWG